MQENTKPVDLMRAFKVVRALMPIHANESPAEAAKRMLEEGSDFLEVSELLGIEIEELVGDLEMLKEILVNIDPELAARLHVGMPEVLVRVADGHADVVAANRAVHVRIADNDIGDPEETQKALEGETFEGTPMDISSAVAAISDEMATLMAPVLRTNL